jgi:hypothetical protein
MPLAVTATAGGTSSQGSRSAVQAQYHSRTRTQYHERAPAFGGVSAVKSEIAQLNLPIPPVLISQIFYADFTTRSAKVPLRSELRKDSQIDRPTEVQIQPLNHDTRLMLLIGAVLGLIYVLFLATWFWTTRFLMRPERSARV